LYIRKNIEVRQAGAHDCAVKNGVDLKALTEAGCAVLARDSLFKERRTDVLLRTRRVGSATAAIILLERGEVGG